MNSPPLGPLNGKHFKNPCPPIYRRYQALGNHQAETGGQQIGRHTHIYQTKRCLCRISCMERRQHQMTAQCGMHGNARCFLIPYLAYHDDIRILTHKRTETAGKGESSLLVYFHLHYPVHVILHRILDGKGADFPGRKTTHGCIHSGRLPGTGRSCNQYQAMMCFQLTDKQILLTGQHAKVRAIHKWQIRR